jgi:hypothetical protein
MARLKKPELNLLLADKVEDWANKFEVSNDGYVQGLVEALRTRKNLQVWAALNPIEYLPMPRLRSEATLAKRTRLMTVLRNVLVFFPVALTWAAVGEASKAFAEYLRDNGSNVVNFLDFWQNGYGYLGSEWTLANIALLDFVIVMVVIVLTLAISYFGRKVAEIHSAEEEKTDRERILISIQIATYLFDKQKVTNVTMNQSLARTLDKLLNAADSLEKTTKSLEKTSKSFEKTSARTNNEPFDFSRLKEFK